MIDYRKALEDVRGVLSSGMSAERQVFAIEMIVDEALADSSTPSPDPEAHAVSTDFVASSRPGELDSRILRCVCGWQARVHGLDLGWAEREAHLRSVAAQPAPTPEAMLDRQAAESRRHHEELERTRREDAELLAMEWPEPAPEAPRSLSVTEQLVHQDCTKGSGGDKP